MAPILTLRRVAYLFIAAAALVAVKWVLQPLPASDPHPDPAGSVETPARDDAATEAAPAAETAHGARLLAPLKSQLKQALIAGLQEGPLNAISVCKDRAPAITDALSANDVALGRTSHRLRNPANVAPGWVNDIVKGYMGDGPEYTPRTVSLSANREGYVEPIVLQPMCAACHGASIAADVAAHIEKAYPQDRATGFEVGDLRGVYWVEYPTTQ